MKKQDHQRPMMLAQCDFGKVQTCRCGGYHVHCQQMTFHLSKEGFDALRGLLNQAQARVEESDSKQLKAAGKKRKHLVHKPGLSLVPKAPKSASKKVKEGR